MKKDWNESVAFISGGAQGIGLGIARALARRGVQLALADLDAAALDRSKRELAQLTAVDTFVLDVRDRERYHAVADEAEAALGAVDLLFNNAGVALYTPLPSLEYEQWDLVLGVNLQGVINGIQTFLPRMIDRGAGGYIVNTASGAGLIPGMNVLYATSKYAVVGLSEALKLAAAKHGIDVSVLCPAAVATDIIQNSEVIGGPAVVPPRPETRRKTEAYLASGRSIDDVGEIVLTAMEKKATWIMTDDTIQPQVQARGEALLEAFPLDLGA